LSLFVVIGIAVGLAMDAFAVSVASGVAIRDLKIGHALRIALFFGAFQAIMPVIGWLAGQTLAERIKTFDHWVVFAVLAAVGGKMIYESFKFDAAEKPSNPLNLYVLLMLSIATSIDALAVGFSFALLSVSIVLPVLVIGAVTFVLSLIGVGIGDRLGHFFEKRIEFVGGLVLIGIGVKVLIQHLSA
jgi:putative Mn2+ efflux pump MntP